MLPISIEREKMSVALKGPLGNRYRYQTVREHKYGYKFQLTLGRTVGYFQVLLRSLGMQPSLNRVYGILFCLGRVSKISSLRFAFYA